MKKQILLGAVVIILLPLLFAVLPAASRPDQITVRGSIWNSAGEPLSEVKIQAIRNGRVIKEATSSSGAKTGFYTLSIEGPDSFTLSYRRSDLQSFVLPDLTGGQEINKVMFRQGEGDIQIRMTGEFADKYLKSIQSIEPPPR